MTAGASAAPRWGWSPSGAAGGVIGWLRTWRGQAVAAFAVYLVVCIVYFGLHVLGHFASHSVNNPGGTDQSAYMWDLAWWPHALAHGLNPFYSTSVFVPDRVDLGGEGALMPGPALLLSPVTLLAGPIASFNVIMLAAPVLASLCAFLLCRHVTGHFFASLVGGYLFGFSAYMLGHMLGHADLVLVFPIPAGVHLTLRLLDGRIVRWRYVVLMGLDLWILLTTSTEVALSFVGFSAVALIVPAALVATVRPRLRAELPWIVGAGALGCVLASPVIYYGLKGSVVSSLGDNGRVYGGDALGFFIPTDQFRFGRNYFAELSAQFTSGAGAEAGLYLGPVLVLIIARFTVTRWRRPATRVLLAVLAVIVLATLGSYLHIAGYQTIPLPWKWIDHWLLQGLIPARFGVYVPLVAALVAALWLAASRPGRWGIAKWVAAALAIVALIPNLSSGLWHDVQYNPSFFRTEQYRRMLSRNEVVLMLPYGAFDVSMLWQAETGMWFRQAGGYLGRFLPDDYAADPLWPALVRAAHPTVRELGSFIVRRHVGAVIVNPYKAGPWPGVLAQLGLVPRREGGVAFYQVPARLSG